MERTLRGAQKSSSDKKKMAAAQAWLNRPGAKKLKTKVKKTSTESRKRMKNEANLNDDIFERTNERPPHNDI